MKKTGRAEINSWFWVTARFHFLLVGLRLSSLSTVIVAPVVDLEVDVLFGMFLRKKHNGKGGWGPSPGWWHLWNALSLGVLGGRSSS